MENAVSTEKERREEREVEFIINVEVNSHNSGTLEVENLDEDFDPNRLIETFAFAVNLIKHWHLDNPATQKSNDVGEYIINGDTETNSIYIEIINPCFDFDSLMHSLMYVIGYLKGCLECNSFKKTGVEVYA